MMPMFRVQTLVTAAALCVGWVLAAPAAGPSTSIAHDPIPFAVRGQPLTLKAKVTAAEEPPAVTLYYALFRDAAPFRVSMKATGLGYYVGTVEAGLLTGVDSISYYIEVQDPSGAITETPWYEVDFRDPTAKEKEAAMPVPAPAAPAPVIPVSRSAEPTPSSQSNWKTPALIAGGAAVVLGGAYLLSDSGGGGSDDGGGGSDEDPAGTYAGSVTRCFAVSNASQQCESHAMQILVDAQKIVFTDTLHPGQQLTGQLNADNGFVLNASVSGGGTNGTVVYEGNVVGQKILGSVSGSATTPSGEGQYSGTFSSTKQ